MENFIIMIASLAPGFVGIAVQKLLNGDTTSGAVQGNIMIYFLYAASSLLCAELVFWFHGPISKLLMNEPIQLVDILVPMGFALIIAVFWHIIGARLAKMFANGINKIAILIPCHRVIGSNGELVGYAGGIWRKQKLLELEKAILF